MKILSVLVALFVLTGCSLAPNTISDSTTNNQDQAPSSVTTGIIRGSVSFPSQGIPEGMVVCAVPTDQQPSICTSELLEGDFTYGLGYELQLPAGEYLVYATVENDPNSTKAYYSEFVTCGLMAECPSHTPIPVTVLPGQTIEGIDPGDWYAPPVACWNRVLETEEGLYWSNGCKGMPLTPDMFCTEALIELDEVEQTGYAQWKSQGSLIDPSCQ